MAFKGNLEGMSLADVFQNIAGNRNSGTLHVQWPRGERYVRFSEGRITGISHGIGKGLPLLPYLIERGFLTQDAAARVRQRLKKSRKSPGRLLVDMRLFDRQALADCLVQLVSENVYDLLALTEARFGFEEGEPEGRLFDIDQRDAGIDLDVGPLLLEGARRIDEWRRIRAVVANDNDLFTAVADPADVEDPDSAAVLSHLDGKVDLAALVAATGLCRFDAATILAGLVQDGLARPLSADEIVELSQETVAAGDAPTAVRLIRAALGRRPRDASLRSQLASILEHSDPAAAATEYAVLGYQAAEEDRAGEALEHIERAIRLHGADVMLHERRCELLARIGDDSGLARATAEFSERLRAMGLLDRARKVLRDAVDSGPLRHNEDLLRRLANLCSELGDQEEAAKRWLALAAHYQAAADLDRQLACLRSALHAKPEDRDLEQRVAELESGQDLRRKRRRRLIARISAAAVLLATIATLSAAELCKARALWQVLSASRRDPDGIETLERLCEAASSWAFLPSSRAAAAEARAHAAGMLDRADELRREGNCERAAAIARAARSFLTGPVRARADALVSRIEVEEPLFGFLSHVEERGTDDGEACEALARATRGDQVPFLIEQLPRAHSVAARQALLRALQGHPGPRIAQPLVEALLFEKDPVTLAQAERLLQASFQGLLASEVADLESRLKDAEANPETRAFASRTRAMLTAPAAAPK
ncbi:MAG: hypothetical protein Fur0037_06520 [Planctomycetota bacterium]